MRIFRFICLVRGFHLGWLELSSMERGEIGKVINGKIHPCVTCGESSPATIAGANLLATWRMK